MYVAMICGGMGSGKSFAVSHFARRGARTLSLDEVSHEVLSNAELKRALMHSFGNDICDNDGNIVRSILAKHAFKDHASAKLLQQISFPFVIARAQQLLKDMASLNPAPDVAIVEVPLLEEAANFASLADEVIAITAPVAMRIERAVERGYERDDIEARIAVQAPDSVRVALADTVIDNNASLDEFKAKLDSWWDEREKQGWKQ